MARNATQTLNIDPVSNVSIEKQPDGRIAIVFDPTNTGEKSKTGKSMVIATTRGFLATDGGVRISLNVIRS